MRLALLAELNAERAARRPAVLVTDIATGDQRLVKGEALKSDPLAPLLSDVVKSRQSGLVAVAGRARLFFTVAVPPPRLLVTGAVHISQALAPMAKLCGYDVVIIDPRTAFASTARFPDAELLQEWPDTALPRLGLDPQTAVVALTHDPKIDDPCLTAALASACFYVGALGSRKTHAKRVERLTAAGFDDAQIARIHAPIGLDIGASSPAEIAVAILAEITAALHGPKRKPAEAGGSRRAGVVRFGEVSLAEALGGTAVHSIRQGDLVLKKGTVIGPAEIAALAAAGLDRIVVAKLEPGDVGEDAAAEAIARAVCGAGVRVDAPFTGRANLFAQAAGVLVLDHAGIDALNGVDEAITLATLTAFKPVVEGEMVGTVKIIPFAVPGAVLARAVATVVGPLLSVAPFVRTRVAVVSTLLPGLAPKVIEKTLKVTAERLAPMGASIIAETRVPHRDAALAAAIGDMLARGAEIVLVFGASAIADRRDVIPAALEAAGGRIEHLGMPVDPGNLLLVGAVGGVPVLGAPGCARSPKENGFDWVLARLAAGLPVTRADITAMGVGGLLMEIVTRPQPREERPAPPHAARVAAVVLAAGRSTRMGGPNKLLEEIEGKPLVRHTVEAALASRAEPVVVVTGHQHEAVAAALADLAVKLVHNTQFAEGLSTSVRAGIAAVPAEADAALVLLGDMPRVRADLIDRLLAAFDPERGALIVVPTREGKRGNPVLWARRFFPALAQLDGDTGARHLIGENAEIVVEVAVDDAAAFLDVDTPEALAALRQQPQPPQ